MFANAIAGAIAETRSLVRLGDLSKDIWQAWGAGQIDDDQAQQLAGALEAQRDLVRPRDTTAGRAPGRVPRLIGQSCFPIKRRAIVSPDRAASIERRRRLAASGPMPPTLACHFTTGELAVLRIVANEVRAKGFCDLFLDKIAALAGVSLCLARKAVRAAARDGFLTIEERRQHRARNLSNIVRIISAEWRSWIARGGRAGGGASTKVESTNTDIFFPVKSAAVSPDSRAFRGREGARSGPMRPAQSFRHVRK